MSRRSPWRERCVTQGIPDYIAPMKNLSPMGLALLLAAPVLAQDSSPVEIQADLRSEYLAGEPILVWLTAENTSPQAASTADLSARPWLVRFTLQGEDGKKTWSTTPPAIDPGGKWTLNPRGRRRVLLEIPSSERLTAAEYGLSIAIDDDGQVRTLPDWTLRLVPPRHVGGGPVYDPMTVENVGFQTAWLHRGEAGYDLYLHHAVGANPQDVIGDYFLHRLDEEVDPVLSLSRPQQSWDRFIYWQQGDKEIWYARLQGQVLRDEPRKIEPPYPELELVSRGSTDARGGLHVPMWVPAPGGAGGELRVASIRGQGGTRFRLVDRFDSRPELVETAVDSSGDLRLLVQDDEQLVIYQLASSGELPAVGKALEDGDRELAAARFGYLPQRGDEPGGLGVLMLFEDTRLEPDGSSVDVLDGGYYALSGRQLQSWPQVTVPDGWSAVDALPRGYDPYVVLLKKDGVKQLLQAQPDTNPVALTWLERPALVASSDGATWLRGFGEAGALSQVRLNAP
jgi:hypothetical protein